MPKFEKNIEFTFVTPPESLIIDPEDENTFPEIKVEMGSLDMANQAILIRVLSCLKITSKDGGADYVFQTSK